MWPFVNKRVWKNRVSGLTVFPRFVGKRIDLEAKMSLIDRIKNAREAGVIVNVLSDAKKYIVLNPKESIDILSCVARESLSFVDLLSFTELKYLTDLFGCPSGCSVHWMIDVLVALSDALSSIEKGSSISSIINLLSRYTKSHSISTVLTWSIDVTDEENYSRLIEYVSILARLPDSIVSLSLGSTAAHECSRRLATAVTEGVREALHKAFDRLREGGSGDESRITPTPSEDYIHLPVLYCMLIKGRHVRVNEFDSLMSTTISYLLHRPKSHLWDEIAQTLVKGGECSVLEEEEMVAAVVENCSTVAHYKRFFGPSLTRNKIVYRACTVRYVMQRSLEKKQTRALIEYVQWAGGMETLKEMSLTLVRVMSTRMGVTAPQREALHRVRVLIECGRRMIESDAIEAASFWKENYLMVMQATRLHVESSDGRAREMGLLVAESVSVWMDRENALHFEYSTHDNNLVEELRRRARGEEEEDEEIEVPQEERRRDSEERRDNETSDDEENNDKKAVQEIDSDDTDDEVYEKLEKKRNRNERNCSNDEGAKVHPPPSYLRDALEWIATEKEKYDKFEAGLAAIEVLFRKRAVGWNEVGLSALRTLVHLDDRFATQGFENTVLRSMVAIVVGQPSLTAPYLADAIFERNVAVKQKYLITTVLLSAARELSGVESGEKTMVNPYKEYDVTKPDTSKIGEGTEQPDWVRIVTERVRSKSRRFSIPPTSEKSSEQKKTSENRFARIADRFILPLLKTKVGEHLDLTGRDIHLLVRVIYTACQLLTLAEHSPSATRIALSLTESVESLRYHTDAAVREVVVAVYFASATVLPEETLALECKPWLEYCISRMNDVEEGERGRKLADETTRIIVIRLGLNGEAEL